MTSAAAELDDTSTALPRPLPHWACALIGVGAAIAGLLPWLVTGMRLPLQNLWDASTPPEGMPLVALPFSQYSLTHLFGLLVTGSAAAGIVARATRARLPRGGFGLILFGLLAVQIGATAQSAATVSAGLQERIESTLYLAVLVGLCAASIALGALVVVLIARAPRAGAGIGLGFGALAAAQWMGALVQPLTLTLTQSDALLVLLTFLQWIPAVLVGAAIAWTGVGSVGRIAAAGGNLLLLWIVPALMTGVSNAAGSRVLAHAPQEMIEYAAQVFSTALLIPEIALRPIIGAIVVAAIGLLLRWAIGRRRRRADAVTSDVPAR